METPFGQRFTQEEIWTAIGVRTDFLIRTYLRPIAPRFRSHNENRHAMMLGVSLAWIERAQDEVPGFREWLAEEISNADKWGEGKEL